MSEVAWETTCSVEKASLDFAWGYLTTDRPHSNWKGRSWPGFMV